MKLFKTLLACMLLFSTLSASAVTEKEMEQARTTAARIYLRWSNNMAGYLDEVNPSTMAELESMLKEDDARNLQAFKNAGVPSNYSGWDKEELIKYWSGTFFDNATGLTTQGTNQGARGRMKAELKKISVSAPQTQPEPAQQPAAENAQNNGAEPVSAITSDNNGSGYDESIQETKDAMSNQDDETGDEEQPAPKDNEGSSGTWVYILILVILVIAVILLVTYASRTMKNGGGRRGGYKPRERRAEYREEARKREREEEKDYPSAIVTPMAVRRAQETAPRTETESSQAQENFNRRLAAKQDEIDGLNNKVSKLQSEIDELSMSVVRLRKENERLKKENETIKINNDRREAGFDTSVPLPATAPETPRTGIPEEATRPADIKEIFLGRVNSNGVFVRADRAFSPGNSVYKLVTTDGFSGTYRVVDNRTLEMLALEHPEEFLSGGCVAKDINDTIGRTSIITESAGTAIFEGGAWRVIRKARIRYD